MSKPRLRVAIVRIGVGQLLCDRKPLLERSGTSGAVAQRGVPVAPLHLAKPEICRRGFGRQRGIVAGINRKLVERFLRRLPQR